MSTREPQPHVMDDDYREGLTVHVGNGYERMVMSEQEICDDVLATIPKLREAVQQDTYGRRWKAGRRKNGVDYFELVPGGCEDGSDDLDIAHAVVAKTELHCHLNEVLNVFINRDTENYQSTMKSLCGRSFKNGRQLFQKRRQLAARQRAPTVESTSSAATNDPTKQPQTALVTVNLNTLRPKLGVKFSARHRRTQKLAFASCTVQYPTKDRAYHVMKTLPKTVHDDLVSSDDRTSLRRELDHIAVGIDVRSKLGGYSASSHTTRIFAHAYASTVPPSQYGRLTRNKNQIAYSSSDLARHRDNMMNPEARTVMETMVKSLRELETIIRRRRFGFQTFVYFPTLQADATYRSCTICQKHFTFFRKDFFCQLCGHTVCGECSRQYEVEATIGEVRKNRCCIQCVVRVDACVFDDEDIVPALGPMIIPVDETEWYEQPTFDDDDTVSVGSQNSSVADSLFSNDPTERSMALERLAQLISPTNSSKSGRGRAKSTKFNKMQPLPGQHINKKNPKKILQGLENHLAESVRLQKDMYQDAEALPVATKERDYAFEFDPKRVGNPNVPLAPVPAPEKEAKRLHYIKESGVLSKDYDRSALDLIAQTAAKKLNCPIGFISVVDDRQFHCIGNHRLPVPAGHIVPRDENLCIHNVYAEAPLILQNPQRDMRFAQMGFIQKMGVKFYAGFPIRAPDGSVVASLCTGDVRPHHNITTKDYATIDALAKLAGNLIMPKEKFGAPPAPPAPPSYYANPVMRDVPPQHNPAMRDMPSQYSHGMHDAPRHYNPGMRDGQPQYGRQPSRPPMPAY